MNEAPGSMNEAPGSMNEAPGSMNGAHGSMNAEAPAGAALLAAESLVNRGIWRLQGDHLAEARACFEEALTHEPAHLEALAQLSTLLANRLDKPRAAIDALRQLSAALDPKDRRRLEVNAALAQLQDRLGE